MFSIFGAYHYIMWSMKYFGQAVLEIFENDKLSKISFENSEIGKFVPIS